MKYLEIVPTTEHNKYAGTYTVTCAATDGEESSEDVEFTLTIAKNLPVESLMTSIPDFLSIDTQDTDAKYYMDLDLTNFCVDPEGLAITYSLYYDKNDVLAS